MAIIKGICTGMGWGEVVPDFATALQHLDFSNIIWQVTLLSLNVRSWKKNEKFEEKNNVATELENLENTESPHKVLIINN